jgi:predicted membrane protein
MFAEGVALAAARWLQGLGLLVAAISGLVLVVRRPTVDASLEHRPSDPVARRERRARSGQIAGLLVLSAIGAELLAAYNDNTGRPAALLFAVLFFAALYGAPALFIREIARRKGWGWPAIILLAFAFAIIQPAVIDQALFSTDYRDIESWNRSLQATFIEPLGFSATNALNFVLGHVIYSFCAPIAVAEAWRPATAHRPWLGLRGMAVAAVLYLVAAVLVLQDPESHSASAMQLAVSLAVAALCVGGAFMLGRRPRREPRQGRTPPLALTVAVSFVLLVAATAVPETWTGAAITTTVLTAGTALLVHASRSVQWSVRHTAAVATGALLSRGVLAFLYYPVIGETSAARKYAHNVTMLAIVVMVGWLALRNPSRTAADATPPESKQVGGRPLVG